MIKLGFLRGKASPCAFRHKSMALGTYIRGDDFVTSGNDEDLKWLKAGLERHYEINTEVLGPDTQDNQQVQILNRIVSWTPEGLEYEADPRHVELIVKELGLENAKGVQSRHQGRGHD